MEPGLSDRDPRLWAIIDQIDAELPTLLAGAPWASVAVRLGVHSATWAWNAAAAPLAGSGVRPETPASERVDRTTVLRWASLAKPVTALLVLRLSAMGRLGLDDAAVAHSASYVPSHANLAGHAAHSITIRHLLTHTSGMGVARYEGIGWDQSRPAAAALLRSTLPHLFWSLAHAPGERLTYGSAAYVWLQSIIEDITGEPFERASQVLLLNPLDLPRVAFLGDGPAPGRIAWGTDARGEPITPRRSPAPAATGLYAPPEDVVRLLAGLATPDPGLRLLLGADLLEQVLTNQTAGMSESWGLGWRLQPSDDGPVFRHAGRPDGVTAYLEGLPRLGLMTCLQVGLPDARRALVRIADIARWHARAS